MLVRRVVFTARAQKYADAAQVACALEGYPLVQGRIPSVLGEVVPGYIKVIPHDLIDGPGLRQLPGQGPGSFKLGNEPLSSSTAIPPGMTEI